MPALPAQSQGTTGAVVTETRNGAISLVSVGTGSSFGPSAVVGLPYSAEEITERTQTLADGTHISQTQARVRYYRDSQGRTRTERQILPGFLVGEPENVPTMIEIRDPAAGVMYNLQPRQKTAQRINFGRPPAVPTTSNTGNTGLVAVAPVVRNANGEAVLPRTAAPVSAPPPPAASQARRPEFSTESLGTRVIEGVVAEGTRHTTTFPVGAFGNDRPITTVSESWFSPELKVTVLSKSSDPRSGETITRLQNINRNEPDPSLFQVPADYQIHDQTVGGAPQ